MLHTSHATAAGPHKRGRAGGAAASILFVHSFAVKPSAGHSPQSANVAWLESAFPAAHRRVGRHVRREQTLAINPRLILR